MNQLESMIAGELLPARFRMFHDEIASEDERTGIVRHIADEARRFEGLAVMGGQMDASKNW